MSIDGGPVPAPTVMLTATEVATAFKLFVAFAVSEWLPAGTLFQAKLYGDVKSSPNLVVPLKNSTLLTVPDGVVAVAPTVTVEFEKKVALLEGLVMLTDGGVELLTAMLIIEELAAAVWLSTALADIE